MQWPTSDTHLEMHLPKIGYDLVAACKPVKCKLIFSLPTIIFCAVGMIILVAFVHCMNHNKQRALQKWVNDVNWSYSVNYDVLK